ncbi:MAG: extracellular catalytic domain type 1 short-chain-length polyhydroxyalkanoate depolymerase [Burkholderiaceae bacterium]
MRFPNNLAPTLRRTAARWRAPLPEPRDDRARPAGRFVEGRVRNLYGSRHYKLYVPSSHAPSRDDAPRPLLVMLHGCGQDPDDFAAGTRMNRLAEERNWLIVYPAQKKLANHAGCWNWFQPAHQARDRGEPSLIAAITREVMRLYRADPRRVYVAGLSAGGAMAAIMAATYPDLYAGLGVHAGLAYGAAHDLPAALAAMRGAAFQGGAAALPPVPTIIFHGDADTTVHTANADRLLDEATRSLDGARGRRETLRERAGGREVVRTLQYDRAGLCVVEQWRVADLGHAWSGGSRDGSHADPAGPDASAEMLRFFAHHAHTG